MITKKKISIYYRTIFQILNLVENGTINTKERKEYLKVFRSQLTESELLFLRYHIKSGNYIKFAFLINKSNLMKHLPLFDILEFKYWREKLNLVEINTLTIFS
ncbi:MAG: putative phage abortive infection protein [Bacteroidales bacterium]|nr:putative phage abortive infection protein [Bacteroidales bacterium]